MVLVRKEELLAIASLVAGAVFFILAAFIPRSISLGYTWNIAALLLALVLIVWSLGTLLPWQVQQPIDRKHVTFFLSSIIIVVTGWNLLIFSMAFITIFPFTWWYYTLVGSVLIILGLALGSRSGFHRTSMDM